MLSVVAAVIEANGKILVCQRPRGDTFELMWEFPGGKVKPGEILPQALSRELLEELGTRAEIGPEHKCKGSLGRNRSLGRKGHDKQDDGDT